ncbi:MAG: hypothetical protein ACLSXO_04065 [Coprococcus sp.]
MEEDGTCLLPICDCMKEKWKIAGISCTGSIDWRNLRVSATESEDLFLKEILDDSTYVKAILGGGYLGKTILYDVDGEKTVVYPNDGEHKTIVRNGEKATVFYGKYRGKDEHKDYRDLFPELDISFFYDPMKELGLKMSEIRQNYQIEVTAEQIENLFKLLWVD